MFWNTPHFFCYVKLRNTIAYIHLHLHMRIDIGQVCFWKIRPGRAMFETYFRSSPYTLPRKNIIKLFCKTWQFLLKRIVDYIDCWLFLEPSQF